MKLSLHGSAGRRGVCVVGSISCSSARCLLIISDLVVVVASFFFSSRRRHTRCSRDWSSDVCSSDLYCGKSPCRPRRFHTRFGRDCRCLHSSQSAGSNDGRKWTRRFESCPEKSHPVRDRKSVV